MTGKITPSRVPSLIIGAVFGVFIGILACWAFEIKEAIIAISIFSVMTAIVCAYACQKKTERIIEYVISILNP
jgi:uncharacterized membrane protein